MGELERDDWPQLRALYATLVAHPRRFEEFSYLLDRYGAEETWVDSARRVTGR